MKKLKAKERNRISEPKKSHKKLFFLLSGIVLIFAVALIISYSEAPTEPTHSQSNPVIHTFSIAGNGSEYCGNNECGSGENYTNCPNDCSQEGQGPLGITWAVWVGVIAVIFLARKFLK